MRRTKPNDQALESTRQAWAQGKVNKKGLRVLVREGVIEPKAALQLVQSLPNPSPALVRWLRRRAKRSK